MSIAKRLNRGFTLVELMIVVAIIGVLAVLAIYGVKKYIANSKTAEARQALGRLGKDATNHYENETMAPAVLAENTSTAVARAICGAATIVPPGGIADVKAKKYQSKAGDWTQGDSSTGWRCLRFELNAPQYYVYNYTTAGALDATTGAAFTGSAQGDLDGNAASSTFMLYGATENARVKLAPQLAVDQEDE